MSNALSWSDVLPLAENWARAIVEAREEYTNTPDLWTGLRQSEVLLVTPGENTPFTKAEQTQISSRVQQIRTFITTTYELTADQLTEVDERLGDIEKASRRLGRKDWLMAFNGAVFSLVLSDLIPPQAVQHILVLAFHGLGYLFGLGGPPTPLPKRADGPSFFERTTPRKTAECPNRRRPGHVSP